jgi:hypothetical protein
MGRQELLQSIATTIVDYRNGEIPAPTPEHVDRWIQQFSPAVQEPMLAELDHVLKRSYLSREAFLTFLKGLAALRRLPGTGGFWQQLCRFVSNLMGIGQRGRAKGVRRTCWEDVKFLDVQKHGASQHVMLELLEQVLSQSYGLTFECR